MAETTEHTFEELHHMTVAQLKEIAKGIENDVLHGYATMHKDQLVTALCEALGIEAHAHHEVVGIDKGAVKTRILQLKTERNAALEAKDHKQLKLVRRRILRLKRKIRKATV